MKRGHFLKSLGGLSLMPFLPKAQAQARPGASNCILVPSETPGPFPLDLTDNAYYFRQDIREDREGVRLRQKVRIIGAGNCQPMPGVRVNIWHCDRDGDYSGYGTEAGLTYCRGYQITDENGECEFITIVPGWYPGRVTHVHFQVHVSTQYSAVSQWTWPHDAVVQAALDHADLYPEGPDPLTPGQDGVFANGYDLQMATLQWDAAAEEYVSEFEATVEGEGTVGVGYEEMRTAQVMELGQHYPNPAREFIVFPLVLHQPGMVSWAVYDLQGRHAGPSHSQMLSVGQHDMRIDFNGLGLSRGSYIAQFKVEVGLESHVLVRRFALVD